VPNAGYHFVKWSDDVMTASRTDTDVTADVDVTAAFALNTYTITATAGEGGTISPAGEVIVEHGDDQPFLVTPDVGYEVDAVMVDDEPATLDDDTYTFVNVTADHTIHVTFALKTSYTLTYTAGTGGTISGQSPQTVEPGGSGTEVTAVPNAGYDFVGWSDGVMTPNRTDTDVTADISVQANFVKRTYTITATAGEGGTIDPSGAVVVDWMTTQAFWVTPDVGYEVDTVTVDGQPSALTDPVANTYTFVNVTADHTIHVTFAPSPRLPPSPSRGSHASTPRWQPPRRPTPTAASTSSSPPAATGLMPLAAPLWQVLSTRRSC
jgi:ribosome-associated toxin RatA of RatAB toxin-antitoxin module